MRNAFLAYIDKHLPHLKNSTTLLAISGGIDSTVMGHLFNQAGLSFAIAHCNFELRGKDSDTDEQFVEALASNFRVPFYSKRFQTSRYAKEKGISIQMAARELRYDFFQDLLKNKYANLAIAHHQNDQFETVLFNLIKGTGINGLTGWTSKKKLVVRPLLFASNHDIQAFAKAEGIVWREDTSNKKTEYLRNKIRHQIVPTITEINPAYLDTYQKTQLRLKEVSDLLGAHFSEFHNKAVEMEGDDLKISITGVQSSPAPTQMLHYTLKSFGFSYTQCIEMTRALTQPGKLFFGDNCTANIDREHIYVSKNFHEDQHVLVDDVSMHAFRSGDGLELETIPNHTSIDHLNDDPNCEMFDKSKLAFPLILRSPKEGDFFFPLGMSGKKKVSDFMIDLKIPVNLKKRVLLVESKGDVVWVVGHRIDNRYKITSDTSEILKMTYTNAPESI